MWRVSFFTTLMYRIVSALLLVVTCHLTLAQGPPAWTVNPPSYQYNMTGVIRVLQTSTTYMNEPGAMIAAFVGAEIRGVVPASDIIFIGPEAYFPITMYSNQVAGEQLNFEVYIPSGDSIFQAVETAIFDRFETLGSPPTPFLLNLQGDCQSQLVLDATDLPLQGTYEAGSEIILEGITSVDPGVMLVLDAPIVRSTQALDLGVGSTLTVRGDGCD